MKNSIYSLAFTSTSLRLNDMVRMAQVALEKGKLDLETVMTSGEYGTVKQRTSERQFREIRKRMEKLTAEQLLLLANGDRVTQKQIAFLSVCKHYHIIRDFVIEVIRDKVMVFDYKITESDYRSFISNKIPLHPELEGFSEKTLKKAKQVQFYMLEQAGIINNAREMMILPQLIHPEVIRVVLADDPMWLKIFLMPDADIRQQKK